MNATPQKPRRTRFAPSPTGLLHLGHAFSALTVEEFARTHQGELLLRIEDTDHTRCRPEFEQAIFEDLKWLGLNWPEPVRRQSEHLDIYQRFVTALTDRGLTYPCFCSRKEILSKTAENNAPIGPDGPLYPGTCRNLSENQVHAHMGEGHPHVFRLDLQKAIAEVTQPLEFFESGIGPKGETGSLVADPEIAGDIVLARKGSTTSYHVSVVVDDHLQGISDVVRGQDLFYATHIHRLLQMLWEFEPPNYHHHPLLRDDTGRRFSKKDKDLSLRSMRNAGISPDQVRQKAGIR